MSLRKLLIIFFFINTFVVMDTIYANGRGKSMKSLLAQATTSFKYDSNVFRTRNNTNSDSIMEVSPVLGFNIFPLGSDLSMKYVGAYGRYVTYQVEDYLHHNLDVNFSSNSDLNWVIDALGNYERSQDSRGNTWANLTLNDSPNFWTLQSATVLVSHSKSDAIASWEGSIKRGYLRYEKVSQSFNDLTKTTYKLKNDYKLSGKTSTYLSISWSDILFPNSNNVTKSDNTETRYVFGAEWKSSGKTVSYAEFGWMVKSYKQNEELNYSDVYINAELNWSRKSYSKIVFSLLRDTNDRIFGNSVSHVKNDAGITWVHQFTRRWHSSLMFKARLDQFNNNETDYYYTISPKMTFIVTRWLSVNTQFSWNNKNSTITNNQYSQFYLNSSITLLLP
ncbi:MAG: outer membrane beta-barrel protein [Bacteroidetes bacterium]|nr:outer membrane beta-barrel protein [Bacteroidota bacterium]